MSYLTLDRSLSCPQPQTIRLLAELVNPDQPFKPLLVTTPVSGPWSAMVAGDLASAASDMGYHSARVLDLRGVNHLTSKPAPELVQNELGAADTDRPLKRKIQVLRPAPALVEKSSEFRDWVREQSKNSSPLILLCGGTLDPSHWLEDPLSWAFLKPEILVACGRGDHDEDQIVQTGERLRRAGLDPAGSVMVARNRSFNLLNYFKWIQDLAPGEIFAPSRVEA